MLQYEAHVVSKSALAFIIPLFILCVSFFIYLAFKWRSDLQKLFTIIAFPSLVFFSLFLLPNQVPDEIWHIYRVFDLHIDGGAMYVPSSISRADISLPTDYAALYHAITAPSDWDTLIPIEWDLSAYLIHLYLFPSFIVDICQLLNINPFLSIIFARLTNGLIFLLAGNWILKKIPFGKTLVCIYLLNPMMIQQESSCAPDAIANIAGLLFISYFVKLLVSNNARINAKQYGLLAALGILLCLSKYAYAPLLLLFLLFVPRLKNKRTRLFIYISVVVACLLTFIWIVFFYQGPNFHEALLLVRNPFDFFLVMTKSLYEMSALWIKETFGLILGALNITVWEPCFWIYCLVLLFSTTFNLGEKDAFARNQKIFIVALTLCLSLALILLFRDWTVTVDQRTDIIMGLQGRYFLPYLILPLLCLITIRSSQYRKNVAFFYSIVLFLILLIDAICIICSFN